MCSYDRPSIVRNRRAYGKGKAHHEGFGNATPDFDIANENKANETRTIVRFRQENFLEG